MAPTSVLVIGATGRQGGAVARRLALAGKAVRAISRDPGTTAGLALAAAGIEVVAGDLRDAPSLRRALAGIDAVFAMTVATTIPSDEVAQGLAIIDAATAVGTPMLAYSSAAHADRRTGIPSVDAKATIEGHVLAAGTANVVLGPGGFFEMVLRDEALAALAAGALVDGLPPDLPVPGIALADYARIVEAVLDDPDLVPARRVDLACDAPTRTAMAAALSSAMGTDVTYHRLPAPAVRAASEHWFQLIDWLTRARPVVDTGFPARTWPQHRWLSFAQWAATVRWRALLAA